MSYYEIMCIFSILYSQNPILNSLQWILVVIDSMMSNCKETKESFAESNIANSLNRLWPWCMMTEQLRESIVHLLHTFTNDCPKGKLFTCSNLYL